MSDRPETIEQAAHRILARHKHGTKRGATEAMQELVSELTREALAQSVVESAQAERQKLERAIAEARRYMAPDTAAAGLDGKAAEIAQLTTVVVTSLLRAVGGSAIGGDGRGQSYSLTDTVAREAIRATSYIVWAHASQREDFPGGDDE